MQEIEEADRNERENEQAIIVSSVKKKRKEVEELESNL